uniref:OSJNBb0002J11.13 protein n=1 Tax=Oryza sativa subsp. japonica TaxID=39947 RepID=Q7F952_ORYSJ|nr:OSJNBb0002J11.13 [Oryza sativa Japonica Group]
MAIQRLLASSLVAATPRWLPVAADSFLRRRHRPRCSPLPALKWDEAKETSVGTRKAVALATWAAAANGYRRRRVKAEETPGMREAAAADHRHHQGPLPPALLRRKWHEIEKFTALVAFYQRHADWVKMERCRKPSSMQLTQRLVYSNILGLDPTLRNGSLKDGSLNTEMLQFKSKFPREVLLCRVGDFYEAVGFDACILVEHAGLNPFGGLRSDSIPKAGCPVMNLRQTLDDLTRCGYSVIQKVGVKLQTLKSGGKTAIGFESGGMDAIAPLCNVIFSVLDKRTTILHCPHAEQLIGPDISLWRECIVEEIQGPTQARARKGRFISGHAHPGSPYVFGLAEVDHDVEFPDPMPVVGISRSAKGYCLISVLETMKTYSAEEGLTEEAVVTKLRICRYHHLYLHSSLRNNSSGTSRWGEFGEGGLLWGECSGKSFEWFDGNPIEELLCKVREIYGLEEKTVFRNVSVSLEGRPQPLYLGTATQIGVIPTEGIPSLLKIVLPPNFGGLPSLYIRDLLLNPPSFDVASSVQELQILS